MYGTLAVTFLAVTGIVYYLLHFKTFNLFDTGNTPSDTTTTGAGGGEGNNGIISGGGNRDNNISSTTTTTRAPTTQYHEYDHITYELIKLIEDVAFGRYEPTYNDCNNRKILCALNKIIKTGGNPTDEECQHHPRFCKYLDIMKDKHSSDRNYSTLPYGARFVLIPEDCHIDGFTREICRMRGYKEGKDTASATTVLPTKQVKIRAVTGKEEEGIHGFIWKPYPNRKNPDPEKFRPSMKELYRRFIVPDHSGEQYNYNSLCCSRLDLEECYENDDLTRFCYYKRFYEIVKQYDGMNTFGLPDPQSALNVYWDKGIYPKTLTYNVEPSDHYPTFLIKRDCCESAKDYIRWSCKYYNIPIRKNDYFTAEDIMNEGI